MSAEGSLHNELHPSQVSQDFRLFFLRIRFPVSGFSASGLRYYSSQRGPEKYSGLRCVRWAGMLPPMNCKSLEGKVGVVFGVANKRSIAWAIAQAWAEQGVRLIFNYQGERVKENVEDLTATFGEDVPLYPCDVTSDAEIDTFFQNVRGHTERVDLLLHSVAYAPREALEGRFVSTSREAYRIAHDISAYSLIALAQRAEPLMTHGGSILAMSYYGAEKVIPNYNIMGVAKASLEACTRYLAWDLGKKAIRVNCISAGPVQTLAARGIGGFGQMIKQYGERAPLGRSCSLEEIGATGVFLASDGAAAISGQVLYVDGGYQIMGM